MYKIISEDGMQGDCIFISRLQGEILVDIGRITDYPYSEELSSSKISEHYFPEGQIFPYKTWQIDNSTLVKGNCI